MKIIFLDFDGVLNSEAFYIKRHNGQIPKKEYPLSELCPDAVENLNQLVADTDAKIVISSTWRLGRTKEQLQDILNKVGFVGEIIDVTPSLRDDCVFRGNEIYKWIQDNQEIIGMEYHKFKSYVILDDDSDMLYWQRNNFILVDRFVGMTKGTVFQAKKILNA